MNRLPIRPIVLALSLGLLTACGAMSNAAKQNPREEALYTYVSAVRWGDFNAALTFVDPAVLKLHPVSDLEMERYKQFQVSGYHVKGGGQPTEDTYDQVVEIRLVNRNTQVERVIIDRQNWRWDPEAGRWWLVSGLPDLDAH